MPVLPQGSSVAVQCSPNARWMFPECSLNVARMFPECCPNVPWTLPECCLVRLFFSRGGWGRQLPHNVPWMFPGWSPNVPRMFLEFSPNVHWMLPECCLNVAQMFPECSVATAIRARYGCSRVRKVHRTDCAPWLCSEAMSARMGTSTASLWSKPPPN
jgi:hypothetical protein